MRHDVVSKSPRADEITFVRMSSVTKHLELRCHPNKMHDRLKKISDDRKAGDPKLMKVVFMYIEPEASKRHGEYGRKKGGGTVEVNR